MEIRKYELSFWLSSNFNESEAETLFNDIVKKIEARGGQIVSTQIPLLKTISYPMKKETNGYFSIIQFAGDGLELKELEKELKLNNNILRFVLVKIPEGKQKKITKATKRIFPTKKPAVSQKATVEMSIEELDQKLNEILKE